ncbi:hypothetical protein BDZ89DRAFT_1238367 [Hymenopellis radicata]|nr:hypothetical protein BDZ89DRAFT_1238367 [Hymenopellis radicata]
MVASGGSNPPRGNCPFSNPPPRPHQGSSTAPRTRRLLLDLFHAGTACAALSGAIAIPHERRNMRALTMIFSFRQIPRWNRAPRQVPAAKERQRWRLRLLDVIGQLETSSSSAGDNDTLASTLDAPPSFQPPTTGPTIFNGAGFPRQRAALQSSFGYLFPSFWTMCCIFEPGIFARQSADIKDLSLEEQYIHEVRLSGGREGNVVVTIYQELVELIHSARSTFHDHTYKRVRDKDWKEWEVVLFNLRLNSRTTVARIYMTRETREAFKLAWSLLWNTTRRLTGRPVMFKALHGTGIHTLMVDGSKPQTNGCGDDLAELLRDFDKLIAAGHLTQADARRVRSIRYIETTEELEVYSSWCSNHENWWSDKKSVPCAREADWRVVQSMRQAEKQHVLRDHLNTVEHRNNRNRQRRQASAGKASSEKVDLEEAVELDASLKAAQTVHKALVQRVVSLKKEHELVARGDRDDVNTRLACAESQKKDAWERRATYSHVSQSKRAKLRDGAAVPGKSLGILFAADEADEPPPSSAVSQLTTQAQAPPHAVLSSFQPGAAESPIPPNPMNWFLGLAALPVEDREIPELPLMEDGEYSVDEDESTSFDPTSGLPYIPQPPAPLDYDDSQAEGDSAEQRKRKERDAPDASLIQEGKRKRTRTSKAQGV